MKIVVETAGKIEQEEEGGEFYEVKMAKNGAIQFRSPGKEKETAKGKLHGVESAKLMSARGDISGNGFDMRDDHTKKKLSFGTKKSLS